MVKSKSMKVILLKDIKGVGKRFDEKTVSDGYALNNLLPKGLALIADKAGLAKVAQIKAQSEAKHAQLTAAQQEKENKRLEKRLQLEQFKKTRSQSK